MSQLPASADVVAMIQRKGTLLETAAERLAGVRELLEKSKGGLTADDVHDLRVATRRLEEVLGVFEPLVKTGMVGAAGESLKELRKAAGDLRDHDVLMEHLEHARLPRTLKAVIWPVQAGAGEKRKGLEAKLLATCGSASVSAAVMYIARMIDEQTARQEAAVKTLEESLRRRIKKRRKGVRAAFGEAALKQTPAALHEARIAVKKLRYALELAGEKGKELKELKGFQQLLGDHHDVHVIEETIEGHLPKRAGKGLRPAWRTWRRKTEKRQAVRVVRFLLKGCAWMGGEGRHKGTEAQRHKGTAERHG